jgi:hypothetical protein
VPVDNGVKEISTHPTEIGLGNFLVQELPGYISKEGLISYYAFSGNLYDLSTNMNDGIMKGVEFVTDMMQRPDSCLEFHGRENEFVEIPFDRSMNCTEEISIAAWVYLRSDSTYQAVASRYIESNHEYQRGWNFAFEAKQNGGHLYFFFRDIYGTYTCYETADPVITQLQNEWHHIATTFRFGNGAMGEIYIDGQLANVKWYKFGRNYYPISENLYNNLFIGSSRAEPSGGRFHFFNGRIDDLVIYSRQLTAVEIQTIKEGYFQL